jgi:hypothetical protein
MLRYDSRMRCRGIESFRSFMYRLSVFDYVFDLLPPTNFVVAVKLVLRNRNQVKNSEFMNQSVY